jgi:putative DNA primase/helicase
MSALRSWAHALGGEASGRGVICPGPGHSARDRSLSVTPSATAPNGFLVNSFAGDDPLICLDYVRAKLGLPEFSPERTRKLLGGGQSEPAGYLRPRGT